MENYNDIVLNILRVILSSILVIIVVCEWYKKTYLKMFFLIIVCVALLVINLILNNYVMTTLVCAGIISVLFLLVVSYLEKKNLKLEIKRSLEDPRPAISYDEYLEEQEKENCKPENKPTSMLVD